MNILDLLVRGIEVHISNERLGTQNIVLRFRKGNHFLQHVIKRKDVLDFEGGAVSSSLLEDMLCREVVGHFDALDKPIKITLKYGDWVICNDSKVIGRIVDFRAQDYGEGQIVVKTSSGKRYSAPTKLWKPYHFGIETSEAYMDENASLLNPLGQYATEFAMGHEISIDKALEHPIVQAYKEFLNITDSMSDDLKKSLSYEIGIDKDILFQDHDPSKGEC